MASILQHMVCIHHKRWYGVGLEFAEYLHLHMNSPIPVLGGAANWRARAPVERSETRCFGFRNVSWRSHCDAGTRSLERRPWQTQSGIRGARGEGVQSVRSDRCCCWWEWEKARAEKRNRIECSCECIHMFATHIYSNDKYLLYPSLKRRQWSWCAHVWGSQMFVGSSSPLLAPWQSLQVFSLSLSPCLSFSFSLWLWMCLLTLKHACAYIYTVVVREIKITFLEVFLEVVKNFFGVCTKDTSCPNPASKILAKAT